MEQMTLQQIAQAIGAQEQLPGAVRSVLTDSRALTDGCLFVALVGERFNGHDYIVKALENGALAAVAHERREEYAHLPVLYVRDTLTALMEIGRAYRTKFDIHCVGVTGSVGKTTTKDMIAAVLSSGFQTLKTQGNLNNEIGLPATLFGLDASYQAAVVEMGMQGPGEIAALARIAQPQIGVITNIGVSHIEQLGSRENILQAKLELAQALPNGAPLIVCGDDDLLCRVDIPRLKIIRYGLDNPACTVRAQDIVENSTATTFTLVYDKDYCPVRIPTLGRHNVRNALAAFAVGRALGIPAEQCAQALGEYVPSGMRQKVVEHRGYTVVEDCYNASPDSMRAALQTLAAYPSRGRKIAVLADMLELGDISNQAHKEIGAFAAQQQLELLLTFGQQAALCTQEAQKSIQAKHFYNKAELAAYLRAFLRPKDVVWFKGSRGMRLEDVLEALYAPEPL